MPSYAFPSISLGQQIDNLQIQIETKVSLLWVEPNYGFMSSHLYWDLREIRLSITQQTPCKLLENNVGWETEKYSTLQDIRVHDIITWYCGMLPVFTNMAHEHESSSKEAKTTRQLAPRNGFSRPSFKQSSVSSGGLFDSTTQANPKSLVWNGIAWADHWQCYRWRIPMSEEWGNPQVYPRSNAQKLLHSCYHLLLCHPTVVSPAMQRLMAASPLLHFPWESFTRLEGWQTHGVIKGTDSLYQNSKCSKLNAPSDSDSNQRAWWEPQWQARSKLDIVSAELLECAGTNYHFSLSYLEQQYESYEYEFKAHTCCHGAP